MPSGPVVIRDEQLRRMGSVLFDEYTEKVLAHLREVFPQRMAAAGPEAARKLVDRAVARGKELGFTTERNLLLWIDLSFALGGDWEKKAGLRWLQQIAQDRAQDQSARIYLIYRRLPARCPESGDRPEAP
jgi:hypothetical protein